MHIISGWTRLTVCSWPPIPGIRTGAMIGRPKMTQAETKMESDSMVFNMKTKKGITMNTFTQSGEMYVMGEKMKKISKNDYYAFRGRFTTCNLDTPHFAFRTNKMKLINKKMAITGPVHPEFEGVPIPIYIPFGYFPISPGKTFRIPGTDFRCEFTIWSRSDRVLVIIKY